MNEDLIKQEFVRENIERDIRAIFEAQYLIATERVYTPVPGQGSASVRPESDRWLRRSLVREQGYGRLVRGTTGLLLSALRNPVYSVGFSGRGVVATSNVPLYIRFLDMKKHGNYGIYNRQVWGILWNNSLQTIKYGYGKEVRDRIYAGLQEAFQRMEIRTDS